MDISLSHELDNSVSSKEIKKYVFSEGYSDWIAKYPSTFKPGPSIVSNCQNLLVPNRRDLCFSIVANAVSYRCLHNQITILKV